MLIILSDCRLQHIKSKKDVLSVTDEPIFITNAAARDRTRFIMIRLKLTNTESVIFASFMTRLKLNKTESVIFATVLFMTRLNKTVCYFRFI